RRFASERVEPGTIEVWDTRTGRRIARPLPLLRTSSRVAVSPAGNLVVASFEDGRAAILSVARDWAQTPLQSVSAGLREGVFSAASRLVVTAGGDDALHVWDSTTGEAVTPAIPEACYPRMVATDAEGGCIVGETTSTPMLLRDTMFGAGLPASPATGAAARQP